MNIVYVYGTLRGRQPAEIVKVPGRIYNLGWFPGCVLDNPPSGDTFVAERIEVDDQTLETFDYIEGFRPDDPEDSFYLRVPYLDGWIYVFNNPDIADIGRLIEHGDWEKHVSEADRRF